MLLAPAEEMFEDILNFLAKSPSAEALVNYRPSVAHQQRLSELLDKNRKTMLSEEEQSELNEFLRMNRMMSRLQLKARQYLDQ